MLNYFYSKMISPICSMSALIALSIFSVATFVPLPKTFAQDYIVPNFWDPHERFIKPDIAKIGPLRFITTVDFPPFNYIDANRRLAGFNVDLARAICAELDLRNECSIQALPFDENEAALKNGSGTAIISGLSMTAETRRRLAFTRPYLVLPGRFVVRRESDLGEPLAKALAGKTVGVVDGTSHLAYLKAHFSNVRLRLFLDRPAALSALAQKQVDAVFAGGLQLSFWLHSGEAANCCRFAGGPYLSAEYFGHGLAIAVSPDNRQMLGALNYALRAINDKGVFTELYLRHFPESLF